MTNGSYFKSAIFQYLCNTTRGLTFTTSGTNCANGDDRSVVLFGGLALWALVMMPLLNKRDGAAEKPASLPLSADLKILAIAVVIFIILFVLHPYFAGVSPLPK